MIYFLMTHRFLKKKRKINEEQIVTECVEMSFQKVVSTHEYCFVCGSKKNFTIVPFDARQQAFTKKQIFIPNGNRCCSKHLIKNRFFEKDLSKFRIHSNTGTIKVNDLKKFIECLLIRTESIIDDDVGDYTLSEECLRILTGLTWENLIELREMIISMRSLKSRNATQALVVFLFKLRTGISNTLIEGSKLACDTGGQFTNYPTWLLSRTNPNVDVLNNSLNYYALADLMLYRLSINIKHITLYLQTF